MYCLNEKESKEIRYYAKEEFDSFFQLSRKDCSPIEFDCLHYNGQTYDCFVNDIGAVYEFDFYLCGKIFLSLSKNNFRNEELCKKADPKPFLTIVLYHKYNLLKDASGLS